MDDERVLQKALCVDKLARFEVQRSQITLPILSLVFDDYILGEHHFLWYDVHFLIRLLLFDSLQIIFDLVQLLVIRKVHQFLIS